MSGWFWSNEATRTKESADDSSSDSDVAGSGAVPERIEAAKVTYVPCRMPLLGVCCACSNPIGTHGAYQCITCKKLVHPSCSGDYGECAKCIETSNTKGDYARCSACGVCIPNFEHITFCKECNYSMHVTCSSQNCTICEQKREKNREQMRSRLHLGREEVQTAVNQNPPELYKYAAGQVLRPQHSTQNRDRITAAIITLLTGAILFIGHIRGWRG